MKIMAEYPEETCAAMRLTDLQRYLHVGKNSAIKIGAEAGAKIKYGAMTLYRRSDIDAWLARQ